jgi:hypothetical protein
MAKKKAPAKATKKSAAVKAPAVARQTSTKVKAAVPAASLRMWHAALAVIFGLQGIFFLILSTGRSYPVVINFLTTDPLQTAAQNKPVLTAAWHHLFDLNLVVLVGAMLLVAALFHLLVATVWQSRSEAELQTGGSRLRWTQFAVTGSLLILAVALLAGVQDFTLLLSLVALTIGLNTGNLLAERRAANLRQSAGRAHFVLACVTGGLAWLVVLLSLLAGVVYGQAPAADVWWVFVTAVVLLVLRQVLAGLQRRQTGRWADPVLAERSYMVLNLVLLTLVAWELFAGVLKP